MEKKKYNVPQIEIITLDNEIAMVLQTTPPAGPGESTPENNNKNNESPWE
jgi:hypothetical protein